MIFFRGEGVDIFSDFSFEISMGDAWVTNYLPVKFVIYQTASYLGNVLASRHLAEIDYKEIQLREYIKPQQSLNISNFYKYGSIPYRFKVIRCFGKCDQFRFRREHEVITQHMQRVHNMAVNKSKDTIPNNKIAQQVAQAWY